MDTKDLLSAQWYLVQQRFPGHAVIAIRVIGRDTAFVDPIKLEVLPGNLLAVLCAGIGQKLKGVLRGIAPGNGDARLASCPGSRANAVYEILRRAPACRLRAGIHKIENFDRLSHAIRLF